MEILSIIWVVCWIATIIVAGQRGGFNQGCLAVLTGFLFGPIALIVALRYGAQCPFCKNYINKGATVCPKCQKEQPIKY